MISHQKYQHSNEILNLKKSDDTKDSVFTECKLCHEKYRINTLRGHISKKHKIKITDYKKIYNQEFYDLGEIVLHKCGFCEEYILLDSDAISHHLRNNKKTHENITHANYNRRFLKLHRQDQTSSGNSLAIKYEVPAAPPRTIIGSELDMGVGGGQTSPPAKEAGATSIAPRSVKDVEAHSIERTGDKCPPGLERKQNIFEKEDRGRRRRLERKVNKNDDSVLDLLLSSDDEEDISPVPTKRARKEEEDFLSLNERTAEFQEYLRYLSVDPEDFKPLIGLLSVDLSNPESFPQFFKTFSQFGI